MIRSQPKSPCVPGGCDEDGLDGELGLGDVHEIVWRFYMVLQDLDPKHGCFTVTPDYVYFDQSICHHPFPGMMINFGFA